MTGQKPEEREATEPRACPTCGAREWDHWENFRFSIDTCQGCGYRSNVRHRYKYDEKHRRIRNDRDE